MASQYDFKDLERQILFLEKELSKFQQKFDEILNPIINASFNEKEYGYRKIEQKLDKSVEQAKKDINTLYNDFLNEIRKKIFYSYEEIKRRANEVIVYVNDCNSTIDMLNEINYDFSLEKYENVIDKSKNYYINTNDKKVLSYLLLLRIQAYHNFCTEELEKFNIENYRRFESYYFDCKKYSANKHINFATEYLFIASCISLQKYLSELNEDDMYRICNNATDCYQSFDDNLKSKYEEIYSEIYKASVLLFNNKTEKAYNNFEYSSVINLLRDSQKYKSSDIKIDFFKESTITPEKIFKYINEFGYLGTIEQRKKAFIDAFPLAKTNKKELFIEYWIKTYDENDWSFIEEIIKVQDDRFYMNFIFSNYVKKYADNIKKIDELFLNYANNYYYFLEKNNNKIPLDDFTDSSIIFNALINFFNEINYTKNNESKLNEAIYLLDRLSYGMIRKYKKMCALYNEYKISELNKILSDSSIRLYKKSYKKYLKNNKNKKQLDKTNLLVKLVMAKIKNKKAIIISLTTTMIFMILSIIIIILFTVK